jgi:hypothetical protein
MYLFSGKALVPNEKPHEKILRIFNPNKTLCRGHNGRCLKKPTYALNPPEGEMNRVEYKCKDCAKDCMENLNWRSAMYLFSQEMLELPMEFPPPPGLVHPSKMECQSWRKWG